MKSVEKKIYLGLLVCLLVSVVGVSFAYFTTGVDKIGNGSSVNGETAELIKVQYDAGSSAFTLDDAVPGKSASKNFNIKLTPTSDQKSVTYAINLKIGSNNFVKCNASNKNTSNDCTIGAEELVYTLKENGTPIASATGDLLEKTGTLELAKISKTVESETNFTYTLEVTFKNLGTPQNHNTNKSLTGSIDVIFAE